MPHTVPYVARKLGWKTCPGGYKKSGTGSAAHRHVPLPVVQGLLRQPEVVLGAWHAARASAPDMTEDEARLALERLKAEADALWALHVERNGPAVLRAVDAPPAGVSAHTLGALLDDTSPMPDDLIGPRLLTPGGMLVLGGAPKVGKSDFLINLLVHAAAGAPFLHFTVTRPLRVFYLQAEIQYHYLRERLQQLRLDPGVVARARDTLVVTPKLRMLLDEQGVPLVATAMLATPACTAPSSWSRSRPACWLSASPTRCWWMRTAC